MLHRSLSSILLTAAFVLAGCSDTTDLATTALTSTATPYVQAADPIEAGRYLVIISGCNDCHTPGYMELEGNVPEEQWLTGSPIGWRGPWGTTYPRNLRLTVQSMDEDAFVATLRTRKALPPMPWMNVNKLNEQDARSIYRYIQSLGPAGEQMPAPVPPGVEPSTPYLDMVPQHLERLQATAPPPADQPPANP
jgi:mono/diheme cytochrome c family protein